MNKHFGISYEEDFFHDLMLIGETNKFMGGMQHKFYLDDKSIHLLDKLEGELLKSSLDTGRKVQYGVGYFLPNFQNTEPFSIVHSGWNSFFMPERER